MNPESISPVPPADEVAVKNELVLTTVAGAGENPTEKPSLLPEAANKDAEVPDWLTEVDS